jgi:hypothetical protein
MALVAEAAAFTELLDRGLTRGEEGKSTREDVVWAGDETSGFTGGT